MKLHLGCFHQVHEGWVNTDITPNIFIARIPFAADILFRLRIMCEDHYQLHKTGVFKRVKYLNVLRRFPYRDSSVDAVFCSHMMEHLYVKQAEHMFREVLRVLKPGGVFRVSVPDLEWVMSLFDAQNPDRFLEVIYEHNHGRSKNSHKWMYTQQSLIDFFKRQGFDDVQGFPYRTGRLPDVKEMDSRPQNSIFVEGLCPEKF